MEFFFFSVNYFTMTSSPESDDNSIAVIKEIYDNSKAEELFEMELERALEIGYHVIVIEPNRLADQTTQWIMIGNCLHKGAVIFGLTSLCFCK